MKVLLCISETELLKALKSMKNDEFLGNDGIANPSLLALSKIIQLSVVTNVATAAIRIIK